MNLNFDSNSSTNVNQSRNYNNSNDYSTNVNKNNNNRTIKIGIGSGVVVVVLIVLAVFLYNTIGGSSLEKELVGTWCCTTNDVAEDFTFNSDHTLLVDGEECDYMWEINNSKNLILTSNGEQVDTFVWNEDLVNGVIFDSGSWYLSGNILYMYGERFERQ